MDGAASARRKWPAAVLGGNVSPRTALSPFPTGSRSNPAVIDTKTHILRASLCLSSLSGEPECQTNTTFWAFFTFFFLFFPLLFDNSCD